MKTQIFNSYEDFLKREDKFINGVSKEFAEENPDYEEANSTNSYCWNCEYCTYCWDCRDCVSCEYCANCRNCRYSIYCYRCKGVKYAHSRKVIPYKVRLSVWYDKIKLKAINLIKKIHN
jgi:hypothetical protein